LNGVPKLEQSSFFMEEISIARLALDKIQAVSREEQTRLEADPDVTLLASQHTSDDSTRGRTKFEANNPC
jgi:hypothetical protein